MAAFAKLFDTPDGQLLIVIDGINDDDQYPVRIRGEEYRGIIAEIAPTYDTAEDQQAMFDRFGQGDADESARSLRAMIDNMAPA